MSLFRPPEKPLGLTFMLRGEPGTGKLRFALGIPRIAKKRGKAKPLAVIGTDRSANFYAGDASIGPFVLVEAKSLAEIDAAIAEVKRRKRSFSGVIIDSVTDWWNAQLEAHEVVTKDGGRVVPPRAWRVLREEREKSLRALQRLGIPVALICEERPVFERAADELREVGTREDTDKKEAYLSDIRLRFFQRAGRVCAQVLKDRTGRFAMGAIVENPNVSMWLAPEEAPAAQPQGGVEDQARELIDHIGEIQTAEHWRRWRWKHASMLDTLVRELPDGMTKASLVAIAQAKSAQFETIVGARA